MGRTEEDKIVADNEFKYNMYVLIGAQGGWLQYKWKSLENGRKRLADVFYWAVSTRGDEAYWKGKEKTS